NLLNCADAVGKDVPYPVAHGRRGRGHLGPRAPTLFWPRSGRHPHLGPPQGGPRRRRDRARARLGVRRPARTSARRYARLPRAAESQGAARLKLRAARQAAAGCLLLAADAGIRWISLRRLVRIIDSTRSFLRLGEFPACAAEIR